MIDAGDGAANRIPGVLESVLRKHVRIWCEDGELRYKAPRGVLTPEEVEGLRAFKSEIVSWLEKSKAFESGVGSSTVTMRLCNRAPLAHSQMAHWRLYGLIERPSLRQVASLMSLRGVLLLTALRLAVTELARRHDALRTRVVVVDGIPMQEVTSSVQCELEIHDLSAWPDGSPQRDLSNVTRRHILEPINVSRDSLAAIRLFKMSAEEHLLLIAMEHMISDEFSLGILCRELQLIYAANVNHCPSVLGPVPVQFAEYALWQQRSHESWLAKHGPYWRERMNGCQRVRFPAQANTRALSSGWTAIPIVINVELKNQLRDWCKIRRTTLVMSVLTAYVALVLRWCSASQMVIQYQIDGRIDAKLEDTVGYLSSALSLRVELRRDDTFIDLLRRLTQEFCNASEHADASYLEAQEPRPEYTRNTGFNWVPLRVPTELPEPRGSVHALTWSSVHFQHPMLPQLQRDNEPMVRFMDTEEDVLGELQFPLSRFSAGFMECFGRNVLLFLRALILRSEQCVGDLPLVN